MTLQETMLSQELTNTDLTKIAALQQKRTLAFVNHFVLTNVQFLNNFMRQCEQKLMHFERKLEKVNAAMILLESRLSSIPELNTTTAQISEKIPSEENNNVTATTEDSKDPPQDTKDFTHEESSETVDTKPQVKPEYERFIKMVQVGVPVPAVKLKLSLEGLDPQVFDEILNNK